MCHNPTNMEMKKPCEKTAPLTVAEAYGTSATTTTTTTTTTAPPMTAEMAQEAMKTRQDSLELNDFKQKKRHERHKVTPTLQTGANCGLFAAAMAIKSLLTPYKDGAKMIIPQIAHRLQTNVTSNGLSALGEMYDAEKLAEAINQFLCTITSGAHKHHNAEERYHAQAITVDSEEKFKALLGECTRRGLRVLVPYLACGERDMPGWFDVTKKTEGTEKTMLTVKYSDQDSDQVIEETVGIVSGSKTEEILKSEWMDNAHWCMVYELEADGNVKMVEGNHDFAHTVSFERLFQSNKSLVSNFDWRGYLIRYYEMEDSKETVEEVIAFLGEKIRQLNADAKMATKGEKRRIRSAVKELTAIKTYLEKRELTSTEAKLQYQVIVIGRNSELYDRTTAAATATALGPKVAEGPAAAAAAETDEDSK